MTCPRCNQPDVTTEVCPRCGVVVAKAQARARQAEEPPLVIRPDFEDDTPPRRPVVVYLGIAILVLAGGVLTLRRRAAPVDAAPVAPIAISDPADSAPAPPPPSLASYVPPPAEAPPPPPSDAISDADEATFLSLGGKLGSPGRITEADIATAEGLFRTHPDERAVRDLLKALLLSAAGEDHRQRRFAQAVARLERASVVEPSALPPLQGLVQVQLDAGDWPGAESAARRLIALDARNADAWRGLGYSLMRQDRNREAAEALRTALDIRADGATASLLAKVDQGLSAEEGMTERHLSHFNVRYDGDTHDAVGREILRALERHYATLAGQLDHQPAGTIPVILFSREAYYNASGAPAWSGGVYDSLDGRIRIPIGGLTASLSPEMDGTLIHELTHAFVADRTRGVATREVQEGLAQYMEGRRVGNDLTREELAALADGRVRGVMGYYLSALSFVEYLVANRGMGGMNDLLRAMGETGNVDAAFKQVHGGSYRETLEAWAERLRRQHGS